MGVAAAWRRLRKPLSASELKMAGWRRVLVFFREVSWRSQPPRISPQFRAVGAGLLASAVAAGGVAYHRQQAGSGAAPLTVYADEQKASKRTNDGAAGPVIASGLSPKNRSARAVRGGSCSLKFAFNHER